jgi:hypothetical protein
MTTMPMVTTIHAIMTMPMMTTIHAMTTTQRS